MVTLETSDASAAPRAARIREVGQVRDTGPIPRWLSSLTSLGRSLGHDEIAVAAQWANSPTARELLAERASAGRLDYSGVLRIARRWLASVDGGVGGRGSGWGRGHARLGRRALLSLARLAFHQATEGQDFADSAALYSLAAGSGGIRSLEPADQHSVVTALIESRQHGQADSVVASWGARCTIERQIYADLRNPRHRPMAGASDDLWRHAFSDIFAAVSLEPPRLDDAAPFEHAFDRLVPPVIAPVKGPLVTVVMSCYRPGPEILTAVASILAQSWRSLELLIMDDGSPEEFASLLEQVAALDARIRLVRMPENRGTYTARNAALDLARGEFVTMQDSDDWAHPRRIEIQAGHLVATPDAPSNSSFALRVTDTLALHQPRGRDLKLCEPSLMFRRERVMERIGYFDAVTKGADSEFRKRIIAAFGRESDLVAVGSPLTLQRYRRTSLTGEEIRPRWMHDSRIAYASAYRLWHAEIAAGTSSPFVPSTHSPRRFAAPREIVPGARDSGVAEYDVVYAFDFVVRERDRRTFGAVERAIRADAAAGLSVGISNLWSLGPRPVGPVHYSPVIQRLVSEGQAGYVLTGTAAEIDRLVVPEPSVLAYAPLARLPWRVRSVELGAATPKELRHSRRVPLPRGSVTEKAHALFGQEPLVLFPA